MQTTFYLQFQATHPECNIKHVTFLKMKAYFVKALKDRNTCCKYHVELCMLKVGLNYMRDGKKGLHAERRLQCVEEVVVFLEKVLSTQVPTFIPKVNQTF